MSFWRDAGLRISNKETLQRPNSKKVTEGLTPYNPSAAAAKLPPDVGRIRGESRGHQIAGILLGLEQVTPEFGNKALHKVN